MARSVSDDCLKTIDRFLLSDRAPENSMGLSDLDGFLTGIVIGPELILPSVWLPEIWGRSSPQFKNSKEAQAVMSAIMERYNEIVHAFQDSPPSFDPVFWETKDGLIIAADWAEGFNDAIELRRNSWQPLYNEKRGLQLLKPIMILCGKQGRVRDREMEAQLMAEAADELPASIIAIHEFWNSRKAPG
jgi:uncharacterized protein